ncbi:MAG: HAD-IA family hydrolase [Pseudomonadota bacterium]|nr:HAD-IA family hydrolase [Pseudomonadota bacterium]
MASPELQALIWDIDGTVAETERDGHRVAFNRAFEAAGLPWVWCVSHYGVLLQVAGGLERLLHDMAGREDAPPPGPQRDALARDLHRRKNDFYVAWMAQGQVQARPGVLRLMAECRGAGVRLAVATTSSGVNVQALLRNLLGTVWREHFDAIIAAEQASTKKPDPLVYRLALQALQLAPRHALAIEDSPAGLQAARAAGIACGVTPGAYFGDADFSGAAWVRDTLDAPPPMTLSLLRLWHSATIKAS